jgi:hypothetical protein
MNYDSAVPPGGRPDPPTRCCKVEFIGSYLESNWANVMWVFLTGSGVIPQANLDFLANDFFDKYGDELLPEISFEVELEVCRLNVWDGSEVTQALSTAPRRQGGKSDPGLPASVALSIGWPLQVHYRGGHPRTYLTGITQASLNGSTRVSASYAADVAARAQNFHQLLEATSPGTGVNSVEHGVVSFVRKKAWRTPPVFYRILNGPRVDTRLDSQRRRLGRDVP